MRRQQQELEDIFLDTIIICVEQIQNLGIKYASFSSTFKNNVDEYQDSVYTICDIILEYIQHAEHMVKQRDNYEALLLDRMFANGDITTEVFTNYYPDETLIDYPLIG
jgi:hypothetical protein